MLSLFDAEKKRSSLWLYVLPSDAVLRRCGQWEAEAFAVQRGNGADGQDS